MGAGRFAPARFFEAQEDLPNWGPRLGAAVQRGLRFVRGRQDGAQGERQQVLPPVDDRLRQPVRELAR